MGGQTQRIAEDREQLDEQLAEIARLAEVVAAVRQAREKLAADLEAERAKMRDAGERLASAQEATTASRQEIERLSTQVTALRTELARLHPALGAAPADPKANAARTGAL